MPGAAAPDADLAADVVWFDALMTNVDRTPRNPNLLWLARPAVAHRPRRRAVPASTAPTTSPRSPRRPFPLIREHVLLPYASSIAEADARLAPRVTPAVVEAAVAAIPGDWLGPGADDGGRRAYVEYLLRRLEGPRAFAEEADAAR